MIPTDPNDFAKLVDLTGAQAASAAGMPDPNELAKLAAEFYGTLTRSGIPSEATMPSGVPTGMIPVAPTMPATPAMPAHVGDSRDAGDAEHAGDPRRPRFSFMTDLRSLEGMTGDLSRWGATPSET